MRKRVRTKVIVVLSLACIALLGFQGPALALPDCTQLLYNCLATANEAYENGDYTEDQYIAMIGYCMEAWVDCLE